MTTYSRNSIRLIGVIAIMAQALSCNKEDDGDVREISLLSLTVNGAELTLGTDNVPVNSTLSLAFSERLDPVAFESQLSISSSSGEETLDVTYSNNSSKATIILALQTNTMYTLELGSGKIGAQGGKLNEMILRQFTTQSSQIITSLPPCTSVSECRRTTQLEGSTGSGAFEFYCNYPIYEDQARWEELTQALIVVHGASINPDDYYSYMTNTLSTLQVSESTVLLAPHFRTNVTGDPQDFYWSSLNWREGRESRNTNKISSFEALDQLISRLADTTYFPVLDRIIVTGQSSGGLFTHLFTPANRSEENHPWIEFDYIVSESQYFFYPDGRRINESNGQLYTPSGCTGYDLWPFGYEVVPNEVSAIQEQAFTERFVNRSVTYLLGGANMIDGSLNTSDCSATLLGSTRFMRGDNMFKYMQQIYPDVHKHEKVVVPGVNHQGSVIYQSQEFRELLTDLFKQ